MQPPVYPIEITVVGRVLRIVPERRRHRVSDGKAIHEAVTRGRRLILPAYEQTTVWKVYDGHHRPPAVEIHAAPNGFEARGAHLAHLWASDFDKLMVQIAERLNRVSPGRVS